MHHNLPGIKVKKPKTIRITNHHVHRVVSTVGPGRYLCSKNYIGTIYIYVTLFNIGQSTSQ